MDKVIAILDAIVGEGRLLAFILGTYFGLGYAMWQLRTFKKFRRDFSEHKARADFRAKTFERVVEGLAAHGIFVNVSFKDDEHIASASTQVEIPADLAKPFNLDLMKPPPGTKPN